MARALRVERPGGRYHVTTRGNERKDNFRDDTFLGAAQPIGRTFWGKGPPETPYSAPALYSTPSLRSVNPFADGGGCAFAFLRRANLDFPSLLQFHSRHAILPVGTGCTFRVSRKAIHQVASSMAQDTGRIGNIFQHGTEIAPIGEPLLLPDAEAEKWKPSETP